MQETADFIISKTKGIIDFATCVLFLREADDEHLVAVAAAGPYSETILGRRIPLGSGVSGAAALTGVPSSLDCAAADDLVLLLGASAGECALTEVLAAPLTGEAGTIGAITLYRASDRPFTEDDARLAATVARQASIAVNNARQFEQTKQSALTDQLTGLANARYFFMHLQEELSRANAEHTPVSLIAIDLNKLKQINDSFGHQQGDRVLRILSEVFRRHVRDSDTVVRYAGDEFFIILPNTSNKRAVDTANRIKRAVRETAVEMLPGRFVNLSASFGVATFPGDANDAHSLIAVADRSMYADKRLHEQAWLLSQQGASEEESVSAAKATPGL
jgi:diguanylate cyclase (GGDEF)-like protein